MKNNVNYIGALVAVLLLWIAPHQTCHCQTVDTLSFHDNCNYGQAKFLPSTIAKHKRASSKNRGEIFINYADTIIQDSLKTAFNVAADIWRGYMNFGDTLVLNVKCDRNLSSDIQTNVFYILNGTEGLYYPFSYGRKFSTTVNSNNCDTEIILNPDAGWCVGFGENNASNPKKLTIAIIQSIARGLGYGSTVRKDRRGNYGFTFTNGISVFDTLIVSEDGTLLADQTNRNPSSFNSFVQQECGYLYALYLYEDAYKIYAPIPYDENKSLCRSCDSTSIMYYGEQPISDLIVDDATLKLLSAIGWDFRKEAQVEIVGDGIDSTGIASAYVNHTFRLQTNGVRLSNHQWTYILPLKNGGCDTVATSTNSVITIPAIEDETIYERNIEGDICGTIVYNGLYVDEPVSCSYSITLELKPAILHVELLGINRNSDDPNCFDAKVGVYYVGSHSLFLLVEEEYSSEAMAYLSDAPYYAQFTLKKISTFGGVWLHVSSRNEYGTDDYEYEVPYYNHWYVSASLPNLIGRADIHSECLAIDVYNTAGILVKRIDSLSELADMAKQLYILKIHNGDGTIRTIKYHNR